MRRPRIVRWVITLATASAGLLLAAAIVVRSAWFHDWLRASIVDRAKPVVSGELLIGSLTGDLLHGVTLHDVELRQNGKTVIVVPSISAEYDAIGLLRGHLAFHNVAIIHPTLTFDPATERWPIVIPAQNNQGPARAITIAHMTVTDGTVAVLSGVEAGHRFSSIAFTGALGLAGENVDLMVNDLSGRDEATGVVARRVTTAAHVRGHQITLDQFHILTAASDVTGRAVFGVPAAAVDITIHAAPLSIAELAQYVPLDTDRTLTPSIDAHATGSLSSLHIAGSAQFAQGSGSADVVANLELPTKVIKGTATASALNLAPILGRRELVTRVTGRATFDARVPGTALSKASVTFHVAATDSSIRTYRAHQIDATGSFKSHVLAGTFRASAYGAAWNMHGTWTFPVDNERSRYAIAGEMRGVNLPDLGRGVDIPVFTDSRLQGQLNGTLDVTGSGRALGDQDTTLRVGLVNSTLNGVQIANLDVAAQSSNYQLTADGQGTISGVDARALGLTGDINLLTAGSFRGHIALPDMRTAPTLLTVDASVDATLAPSRINGFSIDEGRVDVALANGVATFNHLTVSGDAGTATATGTLALNDTDASNLTYDLTIADLTTLGGVIEYPLGGRASVTGTLKGTEAAPAFDAQIAGQQLVAESADAVTADAHVTAVVPHWQIANASGAAQAKGTFLTIQGVQFQQASVTTTFAPDQVDVKSVFDRPSQSFAVNVVAAPHPDWHEVQVRQLSIGTPDKLWTSASPDITIRDLAGEIAISAATFAMGDQKISVSGHLPTSRDGLAADLALTLDNVQVADLNTLALGSHKLTGRLDGTARVSGTVGHFTIASQSTVTAGSVDGVTYDKLAANVGYAGNTTTVDLQLTQTATNHLSVTGTAPIDANANGINLKVESSAIDMRLLQPFISRANITRGTAAASATIAGSRNVPNIAGTVTVTDAAVAVPDTGVTYQHVNAQMHFEGETAHIDSMTAEDDDKHVLKAEGGLEGFWSGARAVDVSITTTGFHVLNNSLGQAGVDATLHVGGSVEHPDVTGTIRTTNARVDLTEWLNQFDSDVPETEAGGSILDRTTWHLTLDLPDNVVVQGRAITGSAAGIAMGGVNATLGGSLTVVKEANGHPTLSGELVVLRGTYQFQGRAFQIANGSDVQFRGRDPIDPDLSITAERQASGATIDVTVSGSLRQPDVTLSSDPPLDQGDILALIVFNQPINALGQTERNALANRAAALASGALTAPLADAVARALDLDLVEIMPTTDAGAGPAVAFGRQIGANLFVRVQQGLNDSQSSQISIEYQFARFLRLVTSIAQSAPQSTVTRWAEQSGIDLIFVFRYR